MHQDPDPVTKAELEKILAENNLDELKTRFSSRLEFGTAGLRGELGAGPNRMNQIVVAHAARAIGEFLLANQTEYANPAGGLSVVIGFDARINSDRFAKESAQILAAMGIDAMLFEHYVPTPVAAFSGKLHGASATIMVTASHNPPRDNGYKVYLGGSNGHSQLISPADKQIAELIQRVSQRYKYSDIPRSDDFRIVGAAELTAYAKRATSLAAKESSELKICYTPLHGVGWQVTQEIYRELGFQNVLVVPAQEKPDGNFPTVSFPNPEEKGAMDLAYQLASEQECDIVIAHDPDADRLAVAVPKDGLWKMLTGDEVGILLAEQVASKASHGTLANSIVSSDQLGSVAKEFGLKFEQTLTGFKWISKAKDLIFGYEEALGYCVDPTFTPDKDGITASVLILDLARKLKTENQTLLDQLKMLSERYGFTKTSQVSLRVSDLTIISKIMTSLRSYPPESLGGWRVSYQDLLLGSSLPPTDGLIFSNDFIRAIIRPSGTEPKLKFYLLARGENASQATERLAELEKAARDLLSALQ